MSHRVRKTLDLDYQFSVPGSALPQATDGIACWRHKTQESPCTAEASHSAIMYCQNAPRKQQPGRLELTAPVGHAITHNRCKIGCELHKSCQNFPRCGLRRVRVPGCARENIRTAPRPRGAGRGPRGQNSSVKRAEKLVVHEECWLRCHPAFGWLQTNRR